MQPATRSEGWGAGRAVKSVRGAGLGAGLSINNVEQIFLTELGVFVEISSPT